jgi:hypothetical protein
VPLGVAAATIRPMSQLKVFLRRRLPQATILFKKLRSRVERMRHGDGDVTVFTEIMRENRWQDPDSLSGGGSNLQQTEVIRREIPALLTRIGARSILDAPCGDFYWMRLVDLGDVQYTGADIVPTLIAQCQATYGHARRDFVVRNIIEDKLPMADVILSRDCLVHLSFKHIRQALDNFSESGATYLLTTTFPSRTANWDIVTGSWRPLNFEIAPFHFPTPVATIVEESTQYEGDCADKTLALWRLDSLPRG